MTNNNEGNAIFWFRRDLRLDDNAGLYHALKSGLKVIPVFIFDSCILKGLSNEKDARVHFIHHTLENLKTSLNELGSDLRVYFGNPVEVWKGITSEFKPQAVFANRDYENYALERDRQVKGILNRKEIAFHQFKDHIIFEKDEVLKKDGNPYTVFTPYKRRWLEVLHSRMENGDMSFYLQPYPVRKYVNGFQSLTSRPLISLEEMGFKQCEIIFPSSEISRNIIMLYDKTRNFPAIAGTSRLGVHFRFGTISIRQKAARAYRLNETFLSELIWRDFYSMILQAFPHIETKAFRPEYDRIEWRNNVDEFELWCQGKTGYPLVDAGMRELNASGFMHNRVRMVTAGFLTKHLLIDWRWGEAYFAEKLLDYDLASNNGGWQWAAGTGTDAAPYFRIFNPETQMAKFDPKAMYVKKWVKEWGTTEYPKPMVDHKAARERCLEVYRKGLKGE